MRAPKRVYILAGPNGAGKTTFAREYLTHEANCPAFINADLIADGLSPFAPERAAIRAGRIMLDLIADALRRGESFAFETTLAARNYARAIPQWQAQGYVVKLHFLSLPSHVFRSACARAGTAFQNVSFAAALLLAQRTSTRFTNPSWIAGRSMTARVIDQPSWTKEGEHDERVR